MDEQKQLYQTELITLLRSWDQHSLADRLAELSACGDPDREKRIADAWIVLHFDVGHTGARVDIRIKKFLRDMASLGGDWEGVEAQRAYSHHRFLATTLDSSSGPPNRPQAFINRLMDALSPPVTVGS